MTYDVTNTYMATYIADISSKLRVDSFSTEVPWLKSVEIKCSAVLSAEMLGLMDLDYVIEQKD